MDEQVSMRNLKVKFEKMGDRKFRYGSKVVVVKIDENDSLIVRVGGAWKDIKSFINEQEDEEFNKGSDARESKIGSFNKSLDNMSTVSSNKRY